MIPKMCGSHTLLRFSLGQPLSGTDLQPVITAACKGLQRCCELALNALVSALNSEL